MLCLKGQRNKCACLKTWYLPRSSREATLIVHNGIPKTCTCNQSRVKRNKCWRVSQQHRPVEGCLNNTVPLKGASTTPSRWMVSQQHRPVEGCLNNTVLLKCASKTPPRWRVSQQHRPVEGCLNDTVPLKCTSTTHFNAAGARKCFVL